MDIAWKGVSASKYDSDCSMVGVAVILGIVFRHELVGVGEGTIVAALGVGICIKYVQKIYKKACEH